MLAACIKPRTKMLNESKFSCATFGVKFGQEGSSFRAPLRARESSLYRYRRPLSCRLQFGRTTDVRRPDASPLGSHVHPLHPLFSAPPLFLSPLFLHLVFRIMSPVARTPVTQHDLFSYQLLTASSFSESLLTHARMQAKVRGCAPAVSR